MEAEAEEAASTLSSGLRNASAKVFADEHGESTMIREDPPLEDPPNVTLLEGAAGRPAVIVSGMYGPAGSMGERGPTGPQGLQGPMGPAGASVIGPTGTQGTPGQQGKMGKTGKVGLKGHAGSQGEPGGELRCGGGRSTMIYQAGTLNNWVGKCDREQYLGMILWNAV